MSRDRPDIEIVQCGSWINSFEPFRSLFPPEWHENCRVSGPAFTYGWWGQFMTHTGDFHYPNAATLPRHRRIPLHLPSLQRQIAASVRKHVEKLLAGSGD